MRPCVGIALLIACAACSSKDEPTPTPPKPVSTPQPDPARAGGVPSKADDMKQVALTLRVVDGEGNPVPNVLPIATRQANAFDKPVAQGLLTGPDGFATINVPADQWLFVRAWDPAKKLFANNYYDVLPGEKPPQKPLDIVMYPAATLRVVLLGPDGAPLADQFVGMMLSHPSRGAWWPAETKTDTTGVAVFSNVPPGKYGITIESRSGSKIDVAETTLMPRQTIDLGTLTLR